MMSFNGASFGMQHIKTALPKLKSRINSSPMVVAKEHASYGEITESKAGQGALLLKILSKFFEVYLKNRLEEMI
ncbi:hypothetical protein C5167_040492 [Papaver somniferum]|uniref:Dynamin stalk domain-containing protein n=1 Tax=Papaver somniferum TaxID=3469 RepID=A0A4Y7IF97_PAPSO|nr:hypothetical protein C5167_040492 [Papaver somniferum]